MGGPGFPVTMDRAEVRIVQSRGPAMTAEWYGFKEEGQDCRAIQAGAFWRVCGPGGRPHTITANLFRGTREQAAREMTVLVDAAARGATPAQRQAALGLVARRRDGSVLIGKVRISVLPLQRGGWYFDARPATDRRSVEIPGVLMK